MSKELRASKVAWKKLRRIIVTLALLVGTGAGVGYLLWGGTVILNADGIVTRQRVAVAAPWQDARVREVFVRPGDWVEAGQKIATVESATIQRSLAELAAEKARISSRAAQLTARKAVVTTLLPLAEEHAAQAKEFLNTLQKVSANGLVVSKTLQEMMAANVQASDRLLSLKAEQGSLEIEAEANKKALEQMSAAYDDLQRTYGNGVLSAPGSGYVAANVAMVGEVLSGAKDKVASIYTGPSFVLAYIPESYLFDVAEGQRVAVKARGQSLVGTIEKVLQVTEALPPEFQVPNKVRGRGQLVRVAIADTDAFAIDQKSQVTSCYFENCKATIPGLQKLGGVIARVFSS